MRRLAFIALLGVLSSFASSAKTESVDELKARFEKTRTEDRPQLGIRIAEQQLHNADQLYIDGKVEEARAALADIVTYSEKSRDAAMQTGKHLKNVEIDVRKMSEKLRDIKHTLAFDDQPPVEQAIRQLEDIRTSLLNQMFAKDKNNDKKEKK